MVIYYSLMSTDNSLSLVVRLESDRMLALIDRHDPENLYGHTF